MRFRNWHLQTQISIFFLALTVTAIFAVAVVTDRFAVEAVTGSIGQQLRDLAVQMRDKLDRSMFERYRDIRILAAADRRGGAPGADRERLELLQQSYPDYAWIGYADRQGRVLAATGGLLEGGDVSERPWFQEGLRGPFVGDVHKALLLEKLLDNPDPDAPLRFVDVAMPVTGTDGGVAGVLGAHLSWRWATELKDSVLAPNSAYSDADILVVTAAGDVLLGPADLEGGRLDLAAVAAAREGSGYAIERWPDGTEYLTGYSGSQGYRDYPGLGWIVLARQPIGIALSPVDELQWITVVGAVVIALVFCIVGLVAAARITRPLRTLAEAAGRIGSGERVEVPTVGGFAEIQGLAEALRGMLGRLGRQRRALADANATLESRVAERTAELTEANRALASEIAERRRLESDREALIIRLKEMAETDFLTGVLNRRSFFSVAGKELSAARRYVRSLSVIMLDIDHFKAVNDAHGHLAGDAVLKAVAAACAAELRDSDLVGRYGGEEFVLLMRESDEAGAAAVVERIRARIAATEVTIDGGGRVAVTASFGLATARPDTEDLDSLIRRADVALYLAKEGGRNRIVVG